MGRHLKTVEAYIQVHIGLGLAEVPICCVGLTKISEIVRLFLELREGIHLSFEPGIQTIKRLRLWLSL